MDPEKAIKVNIDNKEYFEEQGFPECAQAIQLGIEALKLIQRKYTYLSVMGDVPLPGETEE